MVAVDCGIKHNIIRLLAKVRVDENNKNGFRRSPDADTLKECLLRLTQAGFHSFSHSLEETR